MSKQNTRKSSKKNSSTRTIRKAVARNARASTRPASGFGAVTTINTAPVSIGNSIRGSDMKTTVTPNGNGVIVRGRDFMFSPIGSGSITTWTLVGGTPLAPACFVDSSLRQFMQMYTWFKVRKAAAHYITSSPTSANGDVMFYYNKDPGSVFLNQTGSNLLQFVLSDPNTVIGPQWNNKTAFLNVSSNWCSTDYGNSPELAKFSAGELFLLSKTSTTDSPGYVIWDYEIEFKERSIIPRLLTLPVGRAQWKQLNVGLVAVAVTTATTLKGTPVGNNLSGTTSTFPTGVAEGDVYKVILDLTNSTSASWTSGTPANPVLANEPNAQTTNTATLQDGSTFYAVVANGTMYFYPTSDAAFVGATSASMYFGASSTITFNYQIWVCLIGTVSGSSINPNY